MISTSRSLLPRCFRYVVVGSSGTGFKFAVYAVLQGCTPMSYLAATAIAVEAGMVHNFCWHLCWIWRERWSGVRSGKILLSLLRFQCCNGAVALFVNLWFMRWLVGEVGISCLLSIVAASLAGGVANFLLADLLVFRVAWMRPDTVRSPVWR